MTATEELRALLDARGVKHGGSDAVVYFEDGRGYKACAYDSPKRYGDGVLCVSHTATPAQAVEATLRRGTCKLPETRIDHGSIEYNGTTSWRRCSECGEEVLAYPANFCPNCGRKVMER